MFRQLPILIVEDECMIALGLSLAVEDCDGVVVGPAATVAEAMALIDKTPVAAAVLDANLADRDVTPVAMKLIEKGVPFVVHTGTGLPAELLDAHPDLKVFPKPSPLAEVLIGLRTEISRSSLNIYTK